MKIFALILMLISVLQILSVASTGEVTKFSFIGAHTIIIVLCLMIFRFKSE